MKASLKWLQWHIHRYLSQLTFFKLVLFALLLWLAGMWLWILPTYHARIEVIEFESQRLSRFLHQQPIVNPTIARHVPEQSASGSTATGSSNLSYDHLLALSAQYHVSMSEYRELKLNGGLQYQITIEGTWLNARTFLGAILALNSVNMLTLDLQRDKKTNLVSITLQLSESHYAPA